MEMERQVAKILMVEYQGRRDCNNEAVGHAPKVMVEYYNYIKENYSVELLAPDVILQKMPETMQVSTRELPDTILMKGKNSFFEKIANKMHMFHNISCAMKNEDVDVLWFFNVEYYLMLYLFLHRKPKQRIVCTLFLDGYHGGIVAKVKQWIFEQAQKKIDFIIATGSNFRFRNVKFCYLPDYEYCPEIYDAYRGMKKDNYAVCLGTMGNGKELEQMVECFNRMNYPLKIVGRFYNQERFKSLKEKAKPNIFLQDTYLTEQEYYTLLAKATYVVLPYSPKQYATQTSGVMQEAIFVNTIVLTYQQILDGAGIKGIGFDSWDQISRKKLLDNENFLTDYYQELIGTIYSREKIKKKYFEIFEGVLHGNGK